MISWLKKITRQLGHSRPGRRFLDHYHRSESPSLWKSWLLVALGGVLVVVGVVISLPPLLPGFLLWIPGFALIASQIKTVAIALDKLECAIRELVHKMKRGFSRRRS